MPSANPPGPLSKQKGLAQGFWLETGDAGGQQVLHSFAVASVSSKGATLDFPNSPGLGAQTPLLILSVSPEKPITWKTQLVSFTDDQDLPTANEPAVLGPMTVPTQGADHCPALKPALGKKKDSTKLVLGSNGNQAFRDSSDTNTTGPCKAFMTLLTT